jgi:hypothetical protein
MKLKLNVFADPPENIEVSESVLTLEEGATDAKVLCTSESYPEASYSWRFSGSDRVVATDNLLFFDGGVTRAQSGEYTCHAHNRHGVANVSTVINVLCESPLDLLYYIIYCLKYHNQCVLLSIFRNAPSSLTISVKPECNIRQSDDSDYIVLDCEALANPDLVTFAWRRGNETLTDAAVTDGLVSSLKLPASAESFGTYFCYVNNSVGRGAPCEIDVQGNRRL